MRSFRIADGRCVGSGHGGPSIGEQRREALGGRPSSGEVGSGSVPSRGRRLAPVQSLHSIRCVPKAWLRSQNRARTEKVALLTATLNPKHHRAYRAAQILRRAAQRTCTLRRGRRYLPGTG